MNTSSSRSKKRTFRLEGLEDRNLLSVASAAVLARHGHAAEIQAASLNKTTLVPVTFLNGSAQGIRAQNGLYGGRPAGFISFSGHGTARPIGPTLIGLQHVSTKTGSLLTISSGTAQITDSKTGERVNIYYSGTGTTAGLSKSSTIQLSGSVVSGTGQYVTASGSFVATGRISAAGRISLQYHVSLN